METLPFFASSLLDPLFLVFDVLDHPDHPQYATLLRDLIHIDALELELYDQEHHLDFHVEKFADKDQGKRAYFLVDALRRHIAGDRLLAIMADEPRPAPYNNEVFNEVPLDKHHMVTMADISPWFGGFTHLERCFTLCPATPGSNSSYWTFNAIIDLLRGKPKEQFKVRLDPFINLKKEEFNPMQYRMSVYGLPLNWDRLRQLKTEEFGQWMSANERQQFLFTDYCWKPSGKELHFTCEELPKADVIRERGSRYFHAIFNIETGLIIHCDGALRIYDEQEISHRTNFHLRNAEVRKTGKRVKIFQIDTPIDQKEFSLILASFFVWNDDVQKYVNQGC